MSVETVYCLGNCALGPNALYDGEIFGKLDANRLDALCALVARKRGSGTMTRVYVPGDASALSVGANPVAKALAREAEARGLNLEIIRNGSHGMFWLEPLLEFVTPQGRIGYGPVQIEDVASLLDAGAMQGGAASAAPRPSRRSRLVQDASSA